MRVLFTTAPLPGHFYPLVPLAWALRAAGHEVLLAAPESFADTVIEAGLPVAASASPVGFAEFMLHDREGRRLEPPRDPLARRRASGRAWGRLAARTLEGTLRLAEEWRPDLIVSEPMEYAGQLTAAKCGIPWVEPGLNFAGFHGPDGPDGPAEEELAPERAALGLAGLPEPALLLDICPPSMRGTAPRHGTPMQHVPYNGPDIRPAWPPRPPGTPRVCLTLGSMLPTHGKLDFPGRMAEMMTALTGLGAEVVVAVDEQVARGWEPLPDGVVAAGRFPLDRALTDCDVLISHGGPGSVFAALVHGVPQLCLPQTSDQFENAALVEQHGLGLRLTPEDASTEAVLSRTEALLRDDSHRLAARAVAAEIALLPAPADIVPVLEKVALSGSAGPVGAVRSGAAE
ncbi:nucleotide disphospho-sugar-binding domain-containing protein [Streptomyces kanamyceticus]|uniref:nucleotide disphospho-sugar-binding domain-containing protein n=1 Tax=Streptomyces kanamyceticus TaxID=1967 RepID=UPI0037DCFB10